MFLPFKINRSITLACLLMLSLNSQMVQAWELQTPQNEASVKVWTQSEQGTNFKAFRGEVIINAPLDQVVSVIRDTPNVPQWYYKSKLAKQLKRLNDHQSLNYSVTDLPWPVSDRDLVILATVSNDSDGGVTIQMRAQPDAYPPQIGLIRVPRLEGFWKLQPQHSDTSQPSVKVTLQISTEPGGDIPSWLVNAMVVDMPFNSLKNLKERVENLAVKQVN